MIITPGLINISGPFGTRTVNALRCGDWAAYRLPEQPELWALTLLPLGFCLPLEWASFTSARNACRAMIHIHRLKNGWARITQADLTLALRDRLIEICRKHGAVEGPVTFTKSADGKRMNGYRRPHHGAG